MLAERALADVIRGPTNTSRLRLAPRHPYAPVGCTTYAHIDPLQAALRAGSYQWESEKIRLMIHGEAYPCGITLPAATPLAPHPAAPSAAVELIEGVGEDDNYHLFAR